MNENKQEDFSFNFDFGNLEVPEIELDAFDVLTDNLMPGEDRYMKPKLQAVNQDLIMYENAERLARELTLNKNERANVIVSGSFIFGDFIEAYIVHHNALVPKMTINTLSLSQNNVDSLHNLIEGDYVQELNLIISDYFYSHERRILIPYIYENLDIDNKFQLAVAGTHMKTCHFETEGGRKIVIHGSANLRSSANIEQFTIEENKELYNFYDDVCGKIIDQYKTINKPIRVSKLWKTITGKDYKHK